MAQGNASRSRSHNQGATSRCTSDTGQRTACTVRWKYGMPQLHSSVHATTPSHDAARLARRHGGGPPPPANGAPAEPLLFSGARTDSPRIQGGARRRASRKQPVAHTARLSTVRPNRVANPAHRVANRRKPAVEVSMAARSVPQPLLCGGTCTDRPCIQGGAGWARQSCLARTIGRPHRRSSPHQVVNSAYRGASRRKPAVVLSMAARSVSQPLLFSGTHRDSPCV